MLNVPGAVALNASLVRAIRMQRHYGACVIVSTQEPTLLTDLIALCSIAFFPRFSNPEWFAAIKRRIPIAPEDRDGLMIWIESPKTGTAFVYSPNTVLGYDDEGQLVKGAGTMLKVAI